MITPDEQIVGPVLVIVEVEEVGVEEVVVDEIVVNGILTAVVEHEIGVFVIVRIVPGTRTRAPRIVILVVPLVTTERVL